MTKVTFFPLLNFALLFVTTPQHTGAANDWSKPCFGGVCSYDLPMSSNGSSGTLKIVCLSLPPLLIFLKMADLWFDDSGVQIRP